MTEKAFGLGVSLSFGLVISRPVGARNLFCKSMISYLNCAERCVRSMRALASSILESHFTLKVCVVVDASLERRGTFKKIARTRLCDLSEIFVLFGTL